ncbi:MAG: LamG-like jellyroll fold domain-containing protein [Actinomycetota bacterium]
MIIRFPRHLVLLLLALAVLVVAAAPAGAATVALWHMNESSGRRMVDASGNGNSGKLTHVKRLSPGFNGKGGAYRFNGRNSRVIVRDDRTLDPGSRDIRITVHVKFGMKPSASVADYDLVRKQSSGGTYKVEIRRSGQAFCKFRGTYGNAAITEGPDLSDDRWHTIVCEKRSSTVTLTVDGEPFERNGAIGSISNDKVLVLGAKETPADWYKGIMDEVRIVFG